jgi:hypothetical protein
MRRSLLLIVTLVVSSGLVGCGGTVCDRLNASSDAFYAGKTECKYTSGGSSITLTKGSTCNDTSKCSADDLKVLDTYATCLGKAQVCSTGNEQKASGDATACAFAAFGGLSTACQDAVK